MNESNMSIRLPLECLIDMLNTSDSASRLAPRSCTQIELVRIEILTRNPDLKSWLEILTRNPDTKS